jgi:hypothetical protein
LYKVLVHVVHCVTPITLPSHIYYLIYNTYIHILQEEVDDVLMMSMDEILSQADDGGLFTPDSIFACREYVKLKGSPPASGNRPKVEFF